MKARSAGTASLARLVAVAAAFGSATWIAASMLATARGPQDARSAAAAQDQVAAPTEPAPLPAAQLNAIEARLRERRKAELAAMPDPSTQPSAVRAEPSDADWHAAAAAMRPHMPNTLERIERSSRNAPARGRMMRALVDRHRELQRIERRDPEQHKREIELAELEDRILGTSRQLARDKDAASADEGRARLREMIGKLTDLRIRNREARLQRLADSVANERRKLEQDKAGREKSIERQYNMMTATRAGGGGSKGKGGPPSGGPRPELAAPVPATSPK